MIPVYKPYIPSKSVEYAKNAIDSSWISSLGEYVDRATDSLRRISGSQYAVLLNNGTSAAHLVTKSLKRFYPDIKRVLVPSACYVAAYNSILFDRNEWDVECIDIDPETWNMKVEHVREGDAIYAVHNLGNIINVPELRTRFTCPIIEDNCEGFFGTYGGVPSGSASLCSAMSFFGNKNITSGEGGAFLTNDREVFEFATKIKGQGQTSKRYIHDELGHNYRMTNIQAAILLGQLENVSEIKAEKKRVFDTYRTLLGHHEHLSIQKCEPGTEHSTWMFGVRIHGLNSYEMAHAYFTTHGIETRPMFYPFISHKHLSDFRGKWDVANAINESVVVLPSYPTLTTNEIEFIAEEVLHFSNIVLTNTKNCG